MSRTLVRSSALLSVLLLAACGDDSDASPEGSGGGAHYGGPALAAETPFEVTHEAALDRVLLVNHTLNRRINELHAFMADDGALGEVRAALGGDEGTEACESGGSVQMEARSTSLQDPFHGEERPFTGWRYYFEACRVSARTGPIDAQRTFDGTVDVLEHEDVTYVAFADPFTQTVTMGGVFESTDIRRSSTRVFIRPTSGNHGTDSVIGHWRSSFERTLGPVAEGAQFDVLGYGGSEVDAVSLRSDASGEGSAFTERRARVQVDYRSNDRDDCVAPGRFDIEGEREVVVEEGPAAGAMELVQRITGAGGVSAEVGPRFLTTSDGTPVALDGFVITIDGEAQEFDTSAASARRRLIEDTCRFEFVGF